MFAVLPLIGVSIAIQPLLGFNYGAHLFERVKKTLWYGIFGATGIGLALWALVHLFPVQIVGFFGITDPNLLSFTVFALQVQLFLIPFVGFQIVGSNYFQATGQPAKSVFLSLTRQILFLIPLYIGLYGSRVTRAWMRCTSRVPWRTSWPSSPPACSSCLSSSVCANWRMASCRPSSSGLFQPCNVFCAARLFCGRNHRGKLRSCYNSSVICRK